jgi:Cu+-exporting ATPase
VSSAAVTGEESSAPVEMEFSVGGMTCAACAARVEKKLNAIDGVVAKLNLATERAFVTAPAAVPVQQLIDAVDQAGYRAQLLGSAAAEGAAEGQDPAAGSGTDAAGLLTCGGD